MTFEACGDGIWKAPGARIIDRTGRKMLPIGRDSFVVAAEGSVVVDKTMLIADVIDSGYSVVQFCRPRRFGKTLNMRMLQAFFELPNASDPTARDRAPLFHGTEVWEANDGYYRQYQGVYPTVYLNLNTVKKLTWEAAHGALCNIMRMEYARFGYLAQSSRLNEPQKALYSRMVEGEASPAELADSLEALCRMLYAHHGTPVALLVDEYDAPVMAGYTNGYLPRGGGLPQRLADRRPQGRRGLPRLFLPHRRAAHLQGVHLLGPQQPAGIDGPWKRV